MTAFEALCGGVPVVASRTGGLVWLCRHAPHACLVTRGRPELLVAGLENVLSPDFPRGVDCGNVYCARPEFDPARRHNHLLSLYEQLL